MISLYISSSCLVQNKNKDNIIHIGIWIFECLDQIHSLGSPLFLPHKYWNFCIRRKCILFFSASSTVFPWCPGRGIETVRRYPDRNWLWGLCHPLHLPRRSNAGNGVSSDGLFRELYHGPLTTSESKTLTTVPLCFSFHYLGLASSKHIHSGFMGLFILTRGNYDIF